MRRTLKDIAAVVFAVVVLAAFLGASVGALSWLILTFGIFDIEIGGAP